MNHQNLLLILVCFIFAGTFNTYAQHPIVEDGKLAYIDSESKKKIVLDKDYVYRKVIRDIGDKQVLDIIWPEWAFPKENIVTVPSIYNIFWIFPIDTTFQLYNLALYKDIDKIALTEHKDDLITYQGNGLVFNVAPYTSGIDYELEERYNYSKIGDLKLGQQHSLPASKDFTYISSFSEGISIGIELDNTDSGYTMFNENFEPVVTGIEKFGKMNDGLIPLKPIGKDGFSYYSPKGKVIIDTPFEDADDFHDGIALVQSNGKKKYINTEGKELFSGFYEGTSFSEGIAAIKKTEGWIIVDKDGNQIVDGVFSRVQSPNEGIISVEKDSEWYFYDNNGVLINALGYYYVQPFREGFAKVWTFEEDCYNVPSIQLVDTKNATVNTVIDCDDYRNSMARLKR